jgi:FKBP-type peptidyl-prolyl cis-trans isomerase FkpA
VDYTGYFMDGKVFDESVSTFSLRGVIAGWREGIPLFGKGGKGKLLIPSRLGYGSNPPPGIPKDAVLLFDIHLIDIK